MKRFLEIVGTVLLFGGGCGVIRELTDGWFRLLGFTRVLTDHVALLQGRELFANIVIAVLGFAVLMISDLRAKA